MYLEKFIVKNFRAIDYLELNFNKGLNVLIGENNSGKTTVIDALRLCLSDFQQPRDIYCSLSDFRVDKSDLNCKLKNIEFHLFFQVEKDIETAWFNDLHVLDENGNNSLQLHHKYEIIDSKLGKRVKRTVWGGAKEGGTVPYEVRLALRNIYLSAIRDVNKNLSPNRANILGDLYSNIIIDEDTEKDQKKKDELLKSITDILDDDNWRTFIGDGNSKISEHLKKLSYFSDGKRQDIKVGFTPFEFDKLVQNLIIQLPIYSEDIIGSNHNEQQYFEIWQNGLGLNNLIYTSAVLGDIKQKKEISKEEYNLLLIEEPESHLHPQLQNTFFNYLEELNKEHEFQIIVTSHSPTITAKTDLNLLSILQNNENKISSTQINELDLEKNSLKYLQKFLDVTKSQLLFANGVILVEGISESILVPIFSKILGEEYDTERNGIEVVNVNGVAFKHFAVLFNSNNEKKRLKCRCGIISDNDEDKWDGKNGKSIKARVKNIENLGSENLEVNFAKKTFEYELFKANPNNELLFEIIGKVHKNLPAKITEKNNIDEQAKLFIEKLTKKSEFAYLLSMELEKNENYNNFNVPGYIEKSIKFVVKGTH
ncbi:MAG: AAA family ATPase [Methanobacteriaceae archaeon]|nr:AAA family ATPase [Methanobacteriaceae archaeon]